MGPIKTINVQRKLSILASILIQVNYTKNRARRYAVISMPSTLIFRKTKSGRILACFQMEHKCRHWWCWKSDAPVFHRKWFYHFIILFFVKISSFSTMSFSKINQQIWLYSDFDKTFSTGLSQNGNGKTPAPCPKVWKNRIKFHLGKIFVFAVLAVQFELRQRCVCVCSSLRRKKNIRKLIVIFHLIAHFTKK